MSATHSVCNLSSISLGAIFFFKKCFFMTGLDVDSEEEEVHFDDSLALEGEHSDSEVLVKLLFLLKASNIATANCATPTFFAGLRDVFPNGNRRKEGYTSFSIFPPA